MKHLARITLLTLVVFALSTFSLADTLSLVGVADTLSLVGVNGATTPTGGEYVGPYTVSVNGTNQNLYCLDLFRDVSFGETWSAHAATLSNHSPIADKEAAIVLSHINDGTISNVTGQLEIWSILDPRGAVANGLTKSQLFYVDTTLVGLASNDKTYKQDFYNEFTLYTAVPGSQSTDGTPQDFIGQSIPVPAPEPSSLLLLGTGLFGSAGILYRRVRL